MELLMTEDEFNRNLGSKVRKARKAAKLDYVYLEKHGISRQLLSMIEQGDGDYSVLDLKAVADILGSDISVLTKS